jgi:N12 class adenine-specific DNA methylase
LTSFEQTIANLEQSLKLTQEQLNKAHSEGIKDRKELNEITASFYEKMVQMESLEAARRRLLEQKTDLEERMNQIMGPDTLGSRAVEPVTLNMDSARPGVIFGGADLNGLITEVDESMVTISIGSADGVKKGMVFHVTRGDDFISDILITDVDTNKSAGVLDLVQQQPRIMDNVSTRL